MSRIFTKGNPAIRWVGHLLLSAAAMALLWGAENTKKPISRDRLFKAIEIGGLTNDEFVAIIKDFGVEFELTADDRQNLVKAGVDDTVMAAIGASFRDPIKEKVAQLTQGGPLAKENIVGLLKAGAGSDIVEALVDKRGISFAMTPAEAKEIEGAGGSKGLLGGLMLKEPVKVIVAAAAPAPAVKEPILVAASNASAVIVPQVEPTKLAPTVNVPAPVAVAPVASQATGAAKTPVTAQAINTAQPGTTTQPINQAAALLTSSAKPAKLLKGGVTYNEMARRVHAVGKVMMEIVINEQGRVEAIKGLSGNPLLVMSATQSMRDWLYEPASVDGRPTKVSTQVSVEFQ